MSINAYKTKNRKLQSIFAQKYFSILEMDVFLWQTIAQTSAHVNISTSYDIQIELRERKSILAHSLETRVRASFAAAMLTHIYSSDSIGNSSFMISFAILITTI